MRFALTAAVWAVIAILISVTFSLRGSGTGSEHVTSSEKTYPVSFEITATFAVEKDPFALNIGEENKAFSILLDGRAVFSTEDGIKDREPFATEEFRIGAGKHELFINANPAQSGLANALRIRVLSSGNPLEDKTFWFQTGQAVNASLIFTLEEKDGKNEH